MVAPTPKATAARVLALLGGPASRPTIFHRPVRSGGHPAGLYLIEKGVKPSTSTRTARAQRQPLSDDARNVRQRPLRNQLAPVRTEGGGALPAGRELMTIYDRRCGIAAGSRCSSSGAGIRLRIPRDGGQGDPAACIKAVMCRSFEAQSTEQPRHMGCCRWNSRRAIRPPRGLAGTEVFNVVGVADG